ncbi:UNVERIFIED_CONTAM: hypothetical protein GTU68_005231, partial [Idotea baltica]|nr:hypothetical protein [Idotea baltica]
IFPGTLWCGSRDRAHRYEHLGERKDLDNCCRTHDHCPIKLNSFSQNYGVANFGFGSKLVFWFLLGCVFFFFFFFSLVIVVIGCG